MNPQDMDLRQYCALNRARFFVDPLADAEWFFGNRDVEKEVQRRLQSDLDIRGVPKSGIVGRFGIGKTHTLNHIKWLVEKDQVTYPLRPFLMDVVWDENNKELNNWRAVHVRILDAMGEGFLRDVVRLFDDKTKASGAKLSDSIYDTFRFGDENLRRSEAIIIAENFQREVRSTVPAWQWLKGDRAAKPENLGVPKVIQDAGDMVFAVLNIGCLYREASGLGIVLLMDEGQSLGDVRKADPEVHRAFLKLAEPENRDVGFVIAIFGGGVAQVPKVLTTPEDIISRLGVTRANLNDAFVEMQRVLRTQADVQGFIEDVLDHLVVTEDAQRLIDDHHLTGVQPNRLPFTDGALAKLTKALYAREENRNPRFIINKLAEACSKAYRQAKESGKYQLVDDLIADTVTQNV